MKSYENQLLGILLKTGLYRIKLTVNHLPSRDEVPVICDVQLVVEYYSR